MEFMWCTRCGEEPAWKSNWCAPCKEIYGRTCATKKEHEFYTQKYVSVVWEKPAAPCYWRSPNRPGGSARN